MRKGILSVGTAAAVWLLGSLPGDVATARATAQGTPQLRVALLGQSIFRYDLRRESPESARQMTELLGGYDVAFTNFEAVIDDGTSRPAHTGLVHSAHPEAMDSLRALGVNLIGLANNHSSDRGEAGVLSNIAHARRAGFVFAGTGANLAEASAPAYLKTTAGIVALLSMVSTGAVRGAASATSAGPNELRVNRETRQLNEDDSRRILTAVRQAAQNAAYVIVHHHNHIDKPDPWDTHEWKRQWARELVDAGAAIYISDGTTWIRGVEIYRSSVILHGLSNFVFQVRRPVHYTTYVDAGPRHDAWASAAASLRFEAGRLAALTLVPLVGHEGTEQGVFYPFGAPRLAADSTARAVLQRFVDRSRPLGTDIRITGRTAEVNIPRQSDGGLR